MIKFFRKIRQSLLSENKVSKYFLYAFGEVVLVVIGILIALNINNNNIKREQEIRVVALLETILNDLSADINNANEVLEFETVQDSIAQQVMNGELTAEMYNTTDYSSYISTVSYFEISDNGYNNLARNVNEIPKEYKEVYKALSVLHSENKLYIRKINEIVINFATELDKKWAATQPWYARHTIMISENRYEPIPEMVEYQMNDPIHKNDAAQLYIILQNHKSTIKQFKHEAVQSYMSIHKLLKNDNELPRVITSYIIDLPSDTYAKYEGTYLMEESDAIKIQIAYENGNLNWTQFGGNAGDEGATLEIFPKSDIEFFDVNEAMKILFEKNSNGDIIGHKAIFGEQEVNFVKSN